MLLNFLWFGLILLAFVSDLLTGMPFSSGMDGLSGARAGLELALTLAGPVCLWSGLSQAMERAGLTEGLCTALRPMLRRLFPVCAKDSEGFWNLCGNLSANLLGLGNAATPLGIRTAQRMQELSGGGGASDELCLLVVMNTASLQRRGKRPVHNDHPDGVLLRHRPGRRRPHLQQHHRRRDYLYR